MRKTLPVTPPSPGLKPRVLLVDLDGTLVGRVHALLCEYDLTRQAWSGLADDKAAARALRTAITSRLRYGVIRPHVEAFFKGAAALNRRLLAANGGAGETEPLEAFIYTASTSEWASYLIPCIESALGVKFNRPLFTREHCVRPGSGANAAGALAVSQAVAAGSYSKSISRVTPLVFRALRRRYPALRVPADLDGRMALVDNTADVLEGAERRLLVPCRTYDYTYLHDPAGRLSVDVLHTRFSQLAALLERYDMFQAPATPCATFPEFAGHYYAQLSRRLRTAQVGNARELGTDRFWQRLADELLRPGAPCSGGTAPFSPTNLVGLRERLRAAAQAFRATQHAASSIHGGDGDVKAPPPPPPPLKRRDGGAAARAAGNCVAGLGGAHQPRLQHVKPAPQQHADTAGGKKSRYQPGAVCGRRHRPDRVGRAGAADSGTAAAAACAQP